jgi:NAD(P)-dependent dehydrogenase (short-subunit alcohol dehydrogenase family)
MTDADHADGGGTDGMGSALARHYLRARSQVIAVGRSHTKFQAMIEALRQAGLHAVAERAEFQSTDLSLLAGALPVCEKVFGPQRTTKGKKSTHLPSSFRV